MKRKNVYLSLLNTIFLNINNDNIYDIFPMFKTKHRKSKFETNITFM